MGSVMFFYVDLLSLHIRYHRVSPPCGLEIVHYIHSSCICMYLRTPCITIYHAFVCYARSDHVDRTLPAPSTMASTLEKQLTAALRSREVRHIRRSLPPSADTVLVDFSSNDYLSLSKSPELRTRFLEKLGRAEQILGSGGSRLLINGSAHVDLEDRLRVFFDPRPAPAQLDALLFNSGFDANVGLFACVPQAGDFIVYDEYIHASVHDGMKISRARSIPFKHNSVGDLEKILVGLKIGRPGLEGGSGSVFIAVESLYSMDGTVSPLDDIVRVAESVFPRRNAYVSVDEAHSTGVYGLNGRGLVNMLGLQGRVFARLHTFGKALAGTGGEWRSF